MVICLAALAAILPLKLKIEQYFSAKPGLLSHHNAALENSFIEYNYEKIVYDIKLGHFKIGEAVFEYPGPKELGGRQVDYMTFTTKAVNFNDCEEIYADPVNFLPLRIIRTIDGWNMKENITEDYDQKNFLLTITKLRNNKTEEIVIKKNKIIQNAVLLPFTLRKLSVLEAGWELPICLPTQDFKIKLAAKEKIKLPSGEFEVFRFESIPERFLIWVTTDEFRVPVKIKGSGKLGYAFEMRSTERRSMHSLVPPKK